MYKSKHPCFQPFAANTFSTKGTNCHRPVDYTTECGNKRKRWFRLQMWSRSFVFSLHNEFSFASKGNARRLLCEYTRKQVPPHFMLPFLHVRVHTKGKHQGCSPVRVSQYFHEHTETVAVFGILTRSSKRAQPGKMHQSKQNKLWSKEVKFGQRDQCVWMFLFAFFQEANSFKDAKCVLQTRVSFNMNLQRRGLTTA